MKHRIQYLWRYIIALVIITSQFLSSSTSTGKAQPLTQLPQPSPKEANGYGYTIYIPYANNRYTGRVTVTGSDWPQLGHDAQRTNSTSEEVDPPYCYAWKWYGVPFASRAQPVVASGRLFIGGMDGVLYARNASSGADLWSFATGGPIRHSAGVGGDIVVVSSHDGYTYGLNVRNGDLLWQTETSASATAPLIDTANQRIFVASTDGKIRGLSLTSGSVLWTYDSGAAIMTSPSLSEDRSMVYFGNEAINAIAVSSTTGALIWKTGLEGQSLTDRYPVVNGSSVYFRSQPLYHFHTLLREGDNVMDAAGSLLSDWSQDWSNVRPQILSFLNNNPSKQSFFALNGSNGASLGTAPVLYTYGNNDIPTAPVVDEGQVYLPYRARHGIQNDSGTVHVTTKYDAELGKLNTSTLDITGLTASSQLGDSTILEFRMTSDEPAVLTMGGNILWVDNWERLGGINIQTKALVHASNVSDNWPECNVECGPGSTTSFFPMSGSGDAYPFPTMRSTEGRSRAGAVIANGMVFWRVIEGGIGALEHDSDGVCETPVTWESSVQSTSADDIVSVEETTARALSEYVTLDLTTPVTSPSSELITRLNSEIEAMLDLANNQHLLPIFVERGFTDTAMWPYRVPSGKESPPRLMNTDMVVSGNSFWFDPGELLYTMAMAYPYLDTGMQIRVKTFMSQEMARYSPLSDLPWTGSNPPWVSTGVQRELYDVSYRTELNNWPPPAVNYSVLYGLWLWSKNTGDWSYAQSHWSQIQALYQANSSTSSILYYADISGAIGYARLAASIKGTSSSEYASGVNAAVAAMQAGLDFGAFKDRANNVYLDPRGENTGWYAPVLYGLTPEVGLYLREQFSGSTASYLRSLETYNSDGVGLIWWYLTRVGGHAETGETSYELPTAAWSHFLGHAYILNDSQDQLITYLDRPWTTGDIYSIQKIVAAIQAD